MKSMRTLAGAVASAALTLTTVAGIAGTAPAANAATYSVTGVDVSAHQHTNGAAINWARVAETEEFAIVKATEGLTGSYDNDWFARDFDGAKANGLVVGTYHYADPGTPVVDDAVGEARHYWSIIKSRQTAGVLPPALDIEENDAGLTTAQLQSWVSSFLAETKRLSGRTPIVYTYPSFWDTTMKTTAHASNPLWIAHYGATTPRIPGGWSTWKMWQYTSGAAVAGIPDSTVDRNYFNGTLTQLKSFASSGTTTTTPTRNGVCEAGEFCYYYNSYQAGSMSDHKPSQSDYGSTQPTCFEFKTAGSGQGLCVKNHAASVWNRTGKTVRVYFNTGYAGTSQAIAAGAKVNLNSTLKNENASHRVV